MIAVEQAKYVNALTSLLRVILLGIDAQKGLSNTQILQVAGWRTRDEGREVKVARAEAVRLAQRITNLDAQIKENTVEITELLQLSEGRNLPEVEGRGRGCSGLPVGVVPSGQVAFGSRVRGPGRSESDSCPLVKHRQASVELRGRPATEQSLIHRCRGADEL